MKTTLVSALAGFALFLGASTDVSAQSRTGDGWWEWALPVVTGQVDTHDATFPPRTRDRDDDDRDDRDRRFPPRTRDREDDDRDERDRRYPPRTRDRDGDRDDDVRYDRGRYGDDARRGRDARRGNGPPFCRNGQGHPVHGWDWCVEKGWAGDRYGYDRYDRNDRWMPARWEDVILRRPAPDRRYTMRQPTLVDILGEVVFGRLARHSAGLGGDGDLTGRWLEERGAGVLQIRNGGLPVAELSDLNADGRFDVVLLARGR